MGTRGMISESKSIIKVCPKCSKRCYQKVWYKCNNGNCSFEWKIDQDPKTCPECKGEDIMISCYECPVCGNSSLEKQKNTKLVQSKSKPKIEEKSTDKKLTPIMKKSDSVWECTSCGRKFVLKLGIGNTFHGCPNCGHNRYILHNLSYHN